jgi:hypothetical protein
MLLLYFVHCCHLLVCCSERAYTVPKQYCQLSTDVAFDYSCTYKIARCSSICCDQSAQMHAANSVVDTAVGLVHKRNYVGCYPTFVTQPAADHYQYCSLYQVTTLCSTGTQNCRLRQIAQKMYCAQWQKYTTATHIK